MKTNGWDRDTGMPIYDYDNSAKLGQAIDRIFAEHDGIDRVTMFCSLSDELYVGRPNEGLSLGNFSITVSRPAVPPQRRSASIEHLGEIGDNGVFL